MHWKVIHCTQTDLQHSEYMPVFRNFVQDLNRIFIVVADDIAYAIGLVIITVPYQYNAVK